MKIVKFLLFSFVLIFTSSCGPEIAFDQPQPAGSENERFFSNKIIGDYLSTSDSSFLTIGYKNLVRTYNFFVVVPKEKLDSNYVLIGDSIVLDKTSGEKMRVEVHNNSIHYQFTSEDTFFTISDSCILREMKGYYFLNYRNPDKTWSVEKLTDAKHKVSISSIGVGDIEKLNDITKTPLDTNSVNFKYSLTGKQFRKFVKQHGFADEETFLKIEGDPTGHLIITNDN